MEQAESTQKLEQFTVVKRAIIYARVSKDEQAETGTSLDNQVEKSRAYAEAQGMNVVGAFRDDYTGKVLNRPELNKVRQMFKDGQADALIVYKTNRLDRSEWGVNLLLLMQELKAQGVELHYSQDGRQVDLHDPMQAFMYGNFAGWQAGEDHRETVQKLAEGRIYRARQGYVLVHSNPPYGYDVIKERVRVDLENRVKYVERSFLEINEAQAAIVRLIYHWYVFGDENGKTMTLAGIAKRLIAMGIPTPQESAKVKRVPRKSAPGMWQPPTVRRIIRSETYAGVWRYMKRNNPKEEQIPVEVPAIVSRELWEAAQERIQRNIDEAPRNTKYQYLMRRRVTCGSCFYKMHAHPDRYRSFYVCSCSKGDKLRQTVECDQPPFNSADVDQVIFDELGEMFHDPEKLRLGLQGYQAATQDKAKPLQEELGHVETLLAQHNADFENAMANMRAAASPRAKATFALDIERIEGVLDQLEKRKKELLASLDKTTLTDEQILALEKFAETIAADWERISQDFDSRRALIEELDLTARLVVEDGEQVVYITGRIAPTEKRLPLSNLRNTVPGLCITISARLVLPKRTKTPAHRCG